MIIFFAPAANSSGIPFVKAYLNGSRIPKAFNLKTLITKIIGCISCVATSLPVGPEGPMIHIGGMVGGGVSQSRSKTLGCELPVLRKFRNDHDRRDFISTGAACGVAAAFGSPVGGILFSMEEASSFWSHVVTWRTFFGCIVSTFTMNVLISGTSGSKSWGAFDNDTIVVFNVGKPSHYSLWELIPFGLLGLFGGLTGALFIKFNVTITQLRRRYIMISNFRRIAEVVFIIFLWSSIVFLFPLFVSCSTSMESPSSSSNSTKLFTPARAGLIFSPMQSYASRSDSSFIPSSSNPVNLEASGELKPVSWDCPSGKFNDVATLLFTSQGSALKQLFSRSGSIEFRPGALVLFTIIYFLGAGYAAGSTMAGGLMVPMLLVGSGYGRLLGLFVKNYIDSSVDPGAYALIGAVSFFGGVSRMTISLSVIMVEITNDLHFLLPIMTTAMISKWVGDMFNHALYDLLIGVQHIPFLEGEPAPFLNKLTVSHVMANNVKSFPPSVSVRDIVEMLTKYSHNGFPVVESLQVPHLRGLILRLQLLVMLEAKVWSNNSRFTWYEFQWRMMNQKKEITDLSFTESELNTVINLIPFMNRSPFSVHSDFNCTFAFRLFRSMGLRHLPIVDDHNLVVGIITKKDLLESVIENKYHHLTSGSRSNIPAYLAALGSHQNESPPNSPRQGLPLAV